MVRLVRTRHCENLDSAREHTSVSTKLLSARILPYCRHLASDLGRRHIENRTDVRKFLSIVQLILNGDAM